ncbi:exonuclease subunit SbcD [Hugenholtzia roseola]|uniref:exonuclease subunit SbcD n=1 Tax=Hugenholtzia roseola TaxID=1002 RepID=UPI000425621A|nr:exonuclease subunit SbcD [Hugenholtzia roseola]
MKILHTADWHLGKKLYDQDFIAAQEKFLDWLFLLIQKEKIEVLIVAGDIFDTTQPPHEARSLYYRFLAKIVGTFCKKVIIIGGNHDSPALLDAPKNLLSFLSISVVGATTDNIEDEIIEIKNESNQLEMVVCAVPFLREKDVNYLRWGENATQREARVKEAIRNHYQKLAQILEEKKYTEKEVPLLATGHLFAQGSLTSDSEKDIYAGNLGQIGAKEFPALFHYIALGHLHRPQEVGKSTHIRYSGSPIALSFSEIKDTKCVLILEFEKNTLTAVTPQPVPIFQKLLRLEGDNISLKSQISSQNLPTQIENEGEVWVEIILHSPKNDKSEQTDLRRLIEDKRPTWKILRFFHLIQENGTEENPLAGLRSLSETNEEEVFLKKCKSDKKTITEIEVILPLFRQIHQEIVLNSK